MAITYSSVPEQYARIQSNMRREKLDAIIALSMENFYWLSNAYVTTMRSIPDRLGAVISIVDEDPVLLTCSIEESLVVEDSWIRDVRTYQEFKESPIAIVAEILRKKGLEKARVGIEMDYIVARFYDELKRELPQMELVDVSRLFLLMRMVKTPREIEILSHAAYATERAMTEGFFAARMGEKEKDVLNDIIVRTLQSGGVEPNGSFGAGPKSAIAHPIADDTPLRYGQIVSVDFGACFKGYYSDIGRTAVVGKSSARQNKIYTSLYDVQRRVIDQIRPGVKACDLYYTCINGLHDAGIDLSLSHCGHGLGLGLHELPLFSPLCDIPIEENMIVNVEPFYVTDEGYHSEDSMLVTKDGVKLLSTYHDHSQILEIPEK